MRALSLNYRDLLVVDGVNRWRSMRPRVPVSDGVGEIRQLPFAPRGPVFSMG
jgi:NADPH:quinone reductase-like Zn-dependent oxidoreductase